MKTHRKLTRRRFFQLSSVAAAAAALGTERLLAAPETGFTIPLSDDGWRMWPDTEAAWQDDALYLPDEVDLARLPIHPPTSGWQALNAQQGIPVTLPASVEQYYWGRFGARPYTKNEYEYAEIDQKLINGAYRGVSWFWRSFELPAPSHGRQVTLHIRGYRQRVEVFANQQLAGYDMIAETSCECDITRLLRPGANTLALRITNPGGVYDWRDFNKLHWGAQEFHAGRGFGGLDRGISLRVHDRVFLDDLWVLNSPRVTEVNAHAEVRNRLLHAVRARVRFTVLERETDAVLVTQTVETSVPAESSATVEAALRHPAAMLWSVESPALYRMRAELVSLEEEVQAHDRREVSFGFRWFEPVGIGSDAMLMLNGKRVRMYSAIEFGTWGFNGLWPTPALARKGDLAAKALGLNALQYHRNIGKHEEFAQDDELGLLRYMEPGGGCLSFQDRTERVFMDRAPATPPPIDTTGNGGEATSWSQRYMEFRILRMIRDHRSHPSLVVYDLQNERCPDLHNARIFQMLHAMHKADPSRTIVLHSGIEPRNQAFFLPWNDAVHVEDGTGYSGWADTHTVGGPGVWQDSLYTDPRNFTQLTGNRREISMQGEMLGWAAPDNHALKLQSIGQGGGHSFDRAEHERILAAYESFLDKWNFRSAFPTAADLFADAGNKLYETWGRILQIIRTDDASDFLVINGWEDQPIDSHSGLVDNQRNFKGDPAPIRAALEPLRPVVQPRGVVHATASAFGLDLFLLNETHRAITGTLALSITGPDGKTTALKSFPAPAFVENQFSWLIAEAVAGPVLTAEGYYTLRFTLEGGEKAEGTTRIFVVDPSPRIPRVLRAGLLGDSKTLTRFLTHSSIDIEEFHANSSCDLAILLADDRDPHWPERSAHLKELMSAVQAGLPLLVLAQTPNGADQVASVLKEVGAFQYAGLVGESRGCWMGTWVFVRDHPAYAGLPSNQVMKWEYQVAFEHSSGLMVDGPGVEVIAGYGRDHDENLAAATFTARLGKGKVLFQAVRGMQPLLYERFIVNAARFLA